MNCTAQMTRTRRSRLRWTLTGFSPINRMVGPSGRATSYASAIASLEARSEVG